MPRLLLDCPTIDRPPREYLSLAGSIFAEFGAQTQDSGNISYGVQIGADRYFVKTAGLVDDPKPLLDFSARVTLLRNSAQLGEHVSHPHLPRLLRVLESPGGPLLVYPWLEGDLLGAPRERRDRPESAFQRFRGLPASEILNSLDAVYDLHAALTQAGWIAADFYDGSLLYDFVAGHLWVIDLDLYHKGPFRNEMGRMFGSSRFMAPEEFNRGTLIDEQTTVFVMGRTGLVFLSDGTCQPEAFRGSRDAFNVLARACRQDRRDRFTSMGAFHRAWQEARGV